MDLASVMTGLIFGIFIGAAGYAAVSNICGLIVDSMTVESYPDLTDAALRMGSDKYAVEWDSIVKEMEREKCLKS